MTNNRSSRFPVIAAVAALAGFAMLVLAPISAKGVGDGTLVDIWQPNWLERHMWGAPDADPEMLARMNRHWSFLNVGVPEAYRNAQSTLDATDENIAGGGALYTKHCARCHGGDGLGDGNMAKGLSPSPALLRHMIDHPVSVDQYLLWTISDGGADFDTDMPAYKEKLAREEIWKIVLYMRAGFPAVTNE